MNAFDDSPAGRAARGGDATALPDGHGAQDRQDPERAGTRPDTAAGTPPVARRQAPARTPARTPATPPATPAEPAAATKAAGVLQEAGGGARAHAAPDGHPAGDAPAPDPDALRHSLAAYATGITLVAAQAGGQPAGLLINSFASVSLQPPLLSVAIGRQSPTLARLRQARCWGISVLGEQQDVVFGQLLRPSPERFSDVDLLAGDGGAVFLPGAAARFTVSPQQEIPAGDHVIVLLRVLGHERDASRAPLVFHGSSLHRLRRPGA